ncbi:expansin EXLX1 family cellulose-binding protein [Streptomyces sp. S.PNR 29]|uniref:expansin EXLX1 family cellulose-binding protein n=1 Tax=Streptomyces sp. S.PNR 29 TaxID=2973805 RepID=UPI0025B16C28|nr:expansin EXLX1 family cellulose-binding protein [Streptomyces sp. S.PNR 29]MDN0194895.1 RlpA-like double-psi beta-barrel domain-containing protein [Streptomyces sp. S.PNR 29]
MASSSHRRPVPRRRRALLSAVAVASAGILIALVMVLRPDGEPRTVQAAATPVASTRPSVSHSAPKPTRPKQSTASATATPTKTTPKPTKTPTTSGAWPSPARTPASTSRPASGTASLAGRIKPGVTYSGVATHYDAADGDGACLYGPSPDLMVAAMNHTDYETAQACGAYIQVRAANGASVTVRITNECPECAPGHVDLSKQAFAKIAALSAGRIPVTWSLLSPSTSDTVSIRYKTGSSTHWCGIQALGHRNPLARLEVSTGGGWRQLTRTEYNYFLSEDGTGCGGPLRLTDIYGEQLTVNGIAVRPDAVQATRVQFARH